MGSKLTAFLRRYFFAAVAASLLFGQTAHALDQVIVRVAGDVKGLRDKLVAASLVVAAEQDKRTAAETIFAAALSDYARMLEALYAEGYYGGIVNVLVDGREAADIPLLNIPKTIRVVDIRVNPGPAFRFGTARISPLAPGTEIPRGFRPGEPAKAPVVRTAVKAATDGWRDAGYAKVSLAGETVSADHKDNTLDTAVGLNPGPVVRFGALVIETPSRVRAAAIRRIAGLPRGRRFSPEAAEEVAQRLRRTGAFGSVTLQEAEVLNDDGTMDMVLSVTDAKRRRLGFGIEVNSLEGVQLSSYWMHRNIFGGAERLRFDASVSNIGGSTGIDWMVGARLETPAPFGPKTRAFVYTTFEHLNEATFTSDTLELGLGVARELTRNLEGEVGLTYIYSETTTSAFGKQRFSMLTLPAGLTWDSRDDTLNPKEGVYVDADVTPFFGLNTTGSGVRSYADARAYYGIGPEKRVVLAGRLQFGSVAGSQLIDTYPDFLFLSGGSGTVRGQPFQSLDVDLGAGRMSGGRSFLGVSGEVRTDLSDLFGVVAFADAGYIGSESFYDGSGEWHAGAGLGLRYNTGLGPIRLDVGLPVAGDTGDGVQFYVGIGQAF